MDFTPSNDPVPADDGLPARDAEFWSRRKTMNARYSQEAFQQPSSLECNLAFVNGDLFSHLSRMNEYLEQVVDRTSDPLDKLGLMQAAMPEINKTSREVRSLTEILTRVDRERNE